MWMDETRGLSGSGPDGAGDDPLERIVGRYVERLNAGEKVTRQEIKAEHPDLAQEILSHLEVYVGLDSGDDLSLEVVGTLGDYTLRRKIGSGGMGVVYEAWQNSMERRVALKVLPPGIAGDTKAVTRFVREAQVAGKLDHPNVVSVHAMGIEGGTPYYAMEFVDGETLAEIISRVKKASEIVSKEDRKKLISSVSRLFGGDGGEPPAVESQAGAAPWGPSSTLNRLFGTGEPDLVYCARIAKAFAEVAEGLQHAHSRGVVHRDLKPSNLILDSGRDQGGSGHGRLRILDFGLAHLEGQQSLTASGDLVGTVLYMSPEQALARRVPIDHRTDVYSLGATLYEALAWRPPFQGKTHQDTLSQIAFRDPEPLRKLNPSIPKDLETIVLKCLLKSPESRYGTAEALAQDLRRFLRGDPIEARPQRALERLARRVARSKGRATAVILAALLALTSGLLVHKHWSDLREREAREAQAAHDAKLSLWRSKVLRAVVKMELPRPSYAQEPAGAKEARERPATKEAPQGEDPARGSAGSVALALEASFPAKALPDPIQEAVTELQSAAQIFPENPETHYHLAIALNRLDREREALAELDRALACDPTFLPALVIRAEASKRPQDEGAAAEGPLDEKLDGASWARAWLKAHRARKEKRWEDAARAYGELIRLEASGVEPYVGFSVSTRLARGRARLEAGDLDGALEDFASARDRWPDLIEPAILLAKAYILKGNAARAEERLQEFHGGRPPQESDEVAWRIGSLFFELADYERALQWDEKLGEGAERERQRALDLWCLGRLEEAERAEERALELEPKSAASHSDLGLIFWRQGKAAEAISEYREATLLDSNLAPAHYNLGRALMSKGELEGAAREISEAIRLRPNIARQHDDLGTALQRMGKLGEAAAEFSRAIAIDPKYMDAHQHLGFVLYKAGNLPEAADVLRKAVQINPKPHEPHCKLGLVLVAQGKLEEAFAELRKAVESDPTCPAGLSQLQRIFRSPADVRVDEELKLLVDSLEAALSSAKDPSPALLETLALAYRYDSPTRNLEKAVQRVRQALEKTGGQSLQGLLMIAEIEYERENLEAAIPALEKAGRLPDVDRALALTLRDWRRQHFPGLASYASIDASLDFQEVAIPQDAAWRCFPGKAEPPASWAEFGFDDAAWSGGASGFGYGVDGVKTQLADMRGFYTTFYIRREFAVADPAALKQGIASVRADDGCVMYLNGEKVGWVRAGDPGQKIPFDGVATTEAPEPVSPVDVQLDPRLFKAGRNVLAVQGLNRSKDSSDFLLVPELTLEYRPDLERDRQRLEKSLALLREKGVPHRAAYLEGRLLQRAGERREAAAKFEEALASDASRPEPYVRLADCLRALGESAAAETRAREALARGMEDAEELWETWFALSAVDLKRTAAEILAAMPIRQPGGAAGTPGSAAGGDDSPEGNLKWLLEQLSRTGAVRVNCGGEDYRDKGDNLWGRDRFFQGGWTPPPPARAIDGTEDDPLYQSRRTFLRWMRPPYSYRVPLVPGRYRIVLCFAELGAAMGFMDAGKSKFDVLLEGKKVLESYEPRSWAASSVSMEESVEDGHLDLEFVHRVGDPQISAISIEPLR